MEKIILSFLKELAKNNDRDWFQENKSVYEEAKDEFEKFINTLIPAIAKFDDSVKMVTTKEAIFRIYRDVRFSKDKSPYKTNFGAFIARGGKKNHGPGYYFHMEPGSSMIAGGIWMPAPDVVKKVRQEIYYNIKEFKAILNSREFKEFYSGLDDWDRQTLPPKEFPKDFPDIELLKNRNFTVSHSLSDTLLGRKELFDYVIKGFRAMYTYNMFLARAIE
jgi:uncharacterized protein (TIGR02453 family)